MDRVAWRATVHGVAKSRTWLSDWTELISLCIPRWMSYTYTYILSFIDFFPFRSLQNTLCYTVHVCWLFVLYMEKAMTPHSSTLAWKIPWTEKSGRLQSMGSLRVRHDWATSLSLFTFMHWRRKWQSTPVFLPGESQGWGSLVGCCLWGCTESDTTEVT